MTAPRHTFLFADLVGFTALAELEGDDRALGDGLMLHCPKASAAVTLGLLVGLTLRAWEAVA